MDLGQWTLEIRTPVGVQAFAAALKPGGTIVSSSGAAPIDTFDVSGDRVDFAARVKSPLGPMRLSFSGQIADDLMTGRCSSIFGPAPFSGRRQ